MEYPNILYVAKKIFFREFMLAYIVITFVLLRLLPSSNISKYIIVLPSLYIIPYLVAQPILDIFNKYVGTIDKPSNGVFLWCIGIISIMLAEIILYITNLYNFKLFIVFIFSWIIIGTLFRCANMNNIHNSKSTKNKTGLLLFSVLIGLSMAIFVTHFLKYPFTNDLDYIWHNFLSLKMIQDNRPLIFNSAYLPTIHTLYAIILYTFDISSTDSLFIWWSSTFLFYPIYSFGIYLFSYQISKNKVISILSCLLSVSVTYHYEAFMFPYHASPKNIIFILFPFAMYIAHNTASDLKKTKLSTKNMVMLSFLAILILMFVILYFTSSEGRIGYEIGFILPLLIIIGIFVIRTIRDNALIKNNIYVLYFVVLTLLFFHKSLGFLAAIILLYYVFLLSYCDTNSNNFKYVVSATLIGTLCLLFLTLFEIIPMSQELIFKPYDTGMGIVGFEKINIMANEIYPLILLAFIGSFLALSDIKKYGTLLIILSCLFISLYIPILGFYRILLFLHPIISLFSAYLIIRVLNKIINTHKIYFILFISISIVLIINISIENNIYELNRDDSVKNVQIEYGLFPVADIIRNTTTKETLVIGYEWHQQSIAAESNRQIIWLWEKGTKRKDIIKNIYMASNSSSAHQQIDALLSNQKYSCMTPDYKGYDCIKDSFERPNAIILIDSATINLLGQNEYDIIDKFNDSRYFYLIGQYNSETIHTYIYGVKNRAETHPLLLNTSSIQQMSQK